MIVEVPSKVSNKVKPLPQDVGRDLLQVIQADSKDYRLVHFVLDKLKTSTEDKMGLRMATALQKYFAKKDFDKIELDSALREVCISLLSEIAGFDPPIEVPHLSESLSFVSHLLSDMKIHGTKSVVDAMDLREGLTSIATILIAIDKSVYEEGSTRDLFYNPLSLEGKTDIVNKASSIVSAMSIASNFHSALGEEYLRDLETEDYLPEVLNDLSNCTYEILSAMLVDKIGASLSHVDINKVFTFAEMLNLGDAATAAREYIEDNLEFLKCSSEKMFSPEYAKAKTVWPKLGRSLICIAKNLKQEQKRDRRDPESKNPEDIEFFDETKKMIATIARKYSDVVPEAMLACSYIAPKAAARAIIIACSKLGGDIPLFYIKSERFYRSLAQAISIPKVLSTISERLEDYLALERDDISITINSIAKRWGGPKLEPGEQLLPTSLRLEDNQIKIGNKNNRSFNRIVPFLEELEVVGPDKKMSGADIKKLILSDPEKANRKINEDLEDLLFCSSLKDINKKIEKFSKSIVFERSLGGQFEKKREHTLKLLDIACRILSGEFLTNLFKEKSPKVFILQSNFALKILSHALKLQEKDLFNDNQLSYYCESILENTSLRFISLNQNFSLEGFCIARDSALELMSAVCRNRDDVYLFGSTEENSKLVNIKKSTLENLNKICFDTLNGGLRDKSKGRKIVLDEKNISFKTLSTTLDICEALVLDHPQGFEVCGPKVMGIVARITDLSHNYLRMKPTKVYQKNCIRRAMRTLALIQNGQIPYIVNKNKGTEKKIQAKMEKTWRNIIKKDRNCEFPEAVLGMIMLSSDSSFAKAAKVVYGAGVFELFQSQMAIDRYQDILPDIIDDDLFMGALARELFDERGLESKYFLDPFRESLMSHSLASKYKARFTAGLDILEMALDSLMGEDTSGDWNDKGSY